MKGTHVAVSDCERIRPGLIGQPANTLSSLAFVVVAVPIARAACRRRRPAWLAVAAAAAFEGLGSVAYHGPGGARSKQLHDAGIAALALTLTVAVAADGAPVPTTDAERSVPTDGRPRFLGRPRAVGLAAAAAALHALSRTGAPLCSCNSPLQGHAVFHVLAAAALAAAADAR